MNLSHSTSPAVVNLRRQQELASEIERKRQKLSDLNAETTRIKTKNASKELEVWKLEDDVIGLRKQYSSSKANADKLHVYEADSLHALYKHYELSCKDMDAEMNRKLLSLKEVVSRKIEASIEEARTRSLESKAQLTQEISRLSAEISALVTELDLRLKVLADKHSHDMSQCEANTASQLASLQERRAVLDLAIAERNNMYQETSAVIKSLKSVSSSEPKATLLSLSTEHASREESILKIREKVKVAQARVDTMEKCISSKQSQVKNLLEKALELRQLLPSLEDQRRVLHGTLQELKGNIRVFCRIRPIDSDSCAHFSVPSDVEINSNGKQVLAVASSSPPSTSHFGKGRTNSLYSFEFDKIFGQESTNASVFSEISQLVQSSLDGSNVCVFAYGQTGSGKTWTMCHTHDGMIPSSFRLIFSNISHLKEQGWEFLVRGQFVEIYNELIIDLLSSEKAGVKHEIKHDDQNRNTEIQNCTTITLESAAHAAEVLDLATARRSTATTMSNSRSSRSHSIFILKLHGYNQNTGKNTQGTLNLVDLAGSERLNLSQTRGDRLKETRAINKSLSCLADVIYCLNQRQSSKTSHSVHVPFRNSKLTYLLKHSLGGDSKTLMFVNISPKEANLNETINSLRFAAKVNNTKTNY